MIVLGRLVAPYGVKGWLHLHAFGDDPASWGRMPDWWLSRDGESAEWQVFHPEAVRLHGDSWVVKLMGMDDRSAAERLVGMYLGAPREALPATDIDEYYWTDLIGLDVVNLQGESLGKVESLLETGANDVLVVKEDKTQRLLPFIESVVKRVDREAARIEVEWGRDW